jgi:hypothetical protein
MTPLESRITRASSKTIAVLHRRVKNQRLAAARPRLCRTRNLGIKIHNLARLLHQPTASTSAHGKPCMNDRD